MRWGLDRYSRAVFKHITDPMSRDRMRRGVSDWQDGE